MHVRCACLVLAASLECFLVLYTVLGTVGVLCQHVYPMLEDGMEHMGAVRISLAIYAYYSSKGALWDPLIPPSLSCYTLITDCLKVQQRFQKLVDVLRNVTYAVCKPS